MQTTQHIDSFSQQYMQQECSLVDYAIYRQFLSTAHVAAVFTCRLRNISTVSLNSTRSSSVHMQTTQYVDSLSTVHVVAVFTCRLRNISTVSLNCSCSSSIHMQTTQHIDSFSQQHTQQQCSHADYTTYRQFLSTVHVAAVFTCRLRNISTVSLNSTRSSSVHMQTEQHVDSFSHQYMQQQCSRVDYATYQQFLSTVQVAAVFTCRQRNMSTVSLNSTCSTNVQSTSPY